MGTKSTIGTDPFRKPYVPSPEKLASAGLPSESEAATIAATSLPAKSSESHTIPITAQPATAGPFTNPVSTTEELSFPKRKPPAKSAQKSSPDLDEALKILAAHGLEAAKKKPVYVKHTFEVEQGLFERLFEMHPVLGKKVKEAVNEALTDWCSKHEKEYQSILKLKEST